MKLETLCNHQKPPILDPENRPLNTPIYQSVKFTFDKLSQVKELFTGERNGYFYSRYKNPTVEQLEQLLARAQNCEQGLACGSGVSAISTTLLSLLNQGDQVIYFIESYRPTRLIIEKILGKFGVSGVKLSLDDISGIEAAMKDPKTKLVIWESPSNPQVKVPDNESIVRLAKEHQVTTVLDNTFAGFHKNQDLEIDIYLHSLSKYAGGHGDVMGGVILSSRETIEKIHEYAVELGPVLDPHSAFLILRGMKTYQLRYDKQVENTSKVAHWLKKQDSIENIFYPEFTSPSREGQDFGTVLMFNLKDKSFNIERFIDRLNLFQLSASLGSTESLVAPALLFYGEDLSDAQREKAGIDHTSIRLSLGIEDCDDLIQDLKLGLRLLES